MLDMMVPNLTLFAVKIPSFQRNFLSNMDNPEGFL